MQRQRGELVPIGDAIGGLSGPVKSIREATPQALHHFTLSDQVNQLVSASEADPDRGFMARTMALCSLPRTNPGNRLQYVRRNGPYQLYMIAGGGNKLPYGSLPRLILAWVCTEAVRTQSRELVLGRSLSEFMRTLDIYSTSGGSRGDRTRLRNQMRRLFNAHVQLAYKDKHGEANVSSSVADRSEFWWNERKPDERVLWESKIYLGEAFFNEIIPAPGAARHEHPQGPHALRAGPGSLPVACLPHLRAPRPAAAHLAAVVRPVRITPCQGDRQVHHSKLPPPSSARVEEDQAGLAGFELRNGQGRLDPASLNTGDRASGRVATAGPIALRKPQGWSATRRRCFGGGETTKFDGKKADNPHRGRRQGDPCDLLQRGHVFAMRALPLQV